jgi:hypothetical protein
MIANITLDDALILPHRANPTGLNFRERQAHLRRILGEFAAYYNESRTHRALSKDAPVHRAIERLGDITSRPILGGLHHQYCRI